VNQPYRDLFAVSGSMVPYDSPSAGRLPPLMDDTPDKPSGPVGRNVEPRALDCADGRATDSGLPRWGVTADELA